MEVGARGHLDGFALPFSRAGLKTEKVKRQVHDVSALGEYTLYRHNFPRD